MLTALLGTPHMQDELAALVLNKAEGVPFFLEELVTALRETGAIDHARRPVAPHRIGHSSASARYSGRSAHGTPGSAALKGAKGVLQTGAVIGREVSGALLQEVVGLPERRADDPPRGSH